MILKNFKPYNQLDYFDCYCKAMFHIMDYFQIDVYRFLLNQLYGYRYTKNDKFSFCLYQYSLQQDTLEYTGLIREIITLSENPIIQINRSIEEGKPVLILIDCFYLPFRIDAYNTSHLNHFICIYGFDSEKRVFYVVDHDYVNSFAYRKHELEYDAFMEFINASRNKQLSFFAFSKDEAIDQSDQSYIQEYSNMILESQELLNSGIDQLRDFLDFFTEQIQGSEVNTFINRILIVIVNITRCVKQREDLLKVYISDRQILAELTVISQKWAIIRSLLLKYVRYEENARASLVSGICTHSNEVFAMEQHLNSKLIQYCKERQPA